MFLESRSMRDLVEIGKFYDNPENYPTNLGFQGQDPRILFDNPEGRPPMYEGDTGWTPEYYKKYESIFKKDGYYKDEDFVKPVLRILEGEVSERINNVRSNVRRSGSKMEQSRLLQDVFYSYFKVDNLK
jgi:hypothetical protein